MHEKFDPSKLVIEGPQYETFADMAIANGASMC